MSDYQNTGETPIMLPMPHPVLVHGEEPRVVIFTKFLSWLTACLLATAVIISLVSVTSERNDLRDQLGDQSTELACRSAASVQVNKAVAARDNSIAQALIYVAEGDNAQLGLLIPVLETQTEDVNLAITAQEQALAACDKR